MIEIILGIGVAAFVIYAAFSISYLVSMKRASERAGKFLTNVEGNVNAALSEIRGTLEHIRKITSDVSAVTDEVRHMAHTMVSLEKGVRDLYGYLKESLGAAAEAHIAGLRAGIATGVVTLVKNLQEKKE
ncbi:MAG TPA: hypothetical protein VF903_01300 [Nitrospirota bacterium]